jgi:hypothetical protein
MQSPIKPALWKVGLTFFGIFLLLIGQWFALEDKISIIAFSVFASVISLPLLAWNANGLRRDIQLWRMGDRSSSARVGRYAGMLIIPLLGVIFWSICTVLFKLHLVSGGGYFFGRVVGRTSFSVMGIAIVWMEFKKVKAETSALP